jgi:hypothetical protein
MCNEAVNQELVDRAAKIGLTLLDKALKIVKITNAFTILVAISPTTPSIGSINVHTYKATVMGINPIGFFSASRISSSIVDSVLAARRLSEFIITEITKPLKRKAINNTISEEIIAPRLIPRKPLFHTSERRTKKFSIVKLAFNKCFTYIVLSQTK